VPNKARRLSRRLPGNGPSFLGRDLQDHQHSEHDTVEDCKKAYLLSWQLGINANGVRLPKSLSPCYEEGSAFRSLMNNFTTPSRSHCNMACRRRKFALTFVRFKPSGIVEHNDTVKMADDGRRLIIFRELAISHRGRTDPAHVHPVDLTPDRLGEGQGWHSLRWSVPRGVVAGLCPQQTCPASWRRWY
jgi:hypothetical protein